MIHTFTGCIIKKSVQFERELKLRRKKHIYSMVWLTQADVKRWPVSSSTSFANTSNVAYTHPSDPPPSKREKFLAIQGTLPFYKRTSDCGRASFAETF
jgi:hypothetical protein